MPAGRKPQESAPPSTAIITDVKIAAVVIALKQVNGIPDLLMIDVVDNGVMGIVDNDVLPAVLVNKIVDGAMLDASGFEL